MSSIQTSVTSFCAVCGDKATKLRYSHYGATSCFSCRAFFRRAIEKNSCVSYSCPSWNVTGTLCKITIATRKKCPHCRFQKCKQVGMSHTKRVCPTHPNGPGYRPVSSCTCSPASTSSTSVDSPAEAASPSATGSSSPSFYTSNPFLAELVKVDSSIVDFTHDDHVLVTELLRLDNFHSYPMSRALHGGTSLSAVKNFLHCALTGGALNFSSICWAYTIGINKLTSLALDVIQDFKRNLSIDDKKKLLLRNLDPMFNIRMGLFFMSDSDNFLEQMDSLDIFDVTMFKRYIPWVKISKMYWNQFFVTPWANSQAHERQYEFLMSKLRTLELDKKSTNLFTVMALCQTDAATELDDEQAVKEMQEKYSRLLLKYLTKSKGQEKAQRLWPQYLHMLDYLKEMADIMRNKSIKLPYSEWPQLEQLLPGSDEQEGQIKVMNGAVQRLEEPMMWV